MKFIELFTAKVKSKTLIQLIILIRCCLKTMASESDANNSIPSAGCSQTVADSYNLRKDINGEVN